MKLKDEFRLNLIYIAGAVVLLAIVQVRKRDHRLLDSSNIILYTEIISTSFHLEADMAKSPMVITTNKQKNSDF